MCRHNDHPYLMCEFCAEVDRQERDYERWKRNNRCEHGVMPENCSTCNPPKKKK